MTSTIGRKARVFPLTIEKLRQMVLYDPKTGHMETIGLFKSVGTIAKSGHVMMPLVATRDGEARGKRRTSYFRVDHIAWAVMTGQWPTGWMEHVNGLRADCSMDNLIHCDPAGDRWCFMGTDDNSLRLILPVEGGTISQGPVTTMVTINGVTKVRPVIKDELNGEA